jgi:biotin carboxylase
MAVVSAASLPAIVKPIDNCSSRGVRWVNRLADIAPAVDAALAASLSGQALIEQFLVGTEGSIEAIVQEGRAIVLGMCDKTKSPLPDRYDLELRYPGAYADREQRDLDQLAQRIASGFEIRDGILHIEFLVSRDSGSVYLIEFAIRGCGSKVVTHLMPVLTGVDVVQVVIRQALGLRAPVEPEHVRHGALHFLMFPPGRVAAIRGVAEALGLPGVIDASVEAKAGERIDEVHDGRSRPGHVLVWGNLRADVQRLLMDVRRRIRLDYDDVTGVAPLELTA